MSTGIHTTRLKINNLLIFCSLENEYVIAKRLNQVIEKVDFQNLHIFDFVM